MLPADEKALELIDDPSRQYLDTFPLGQPFKSLYAVHALHEYLGSSRPKSATSHINGQEGDSEGCLSPRAACLIRVMSLLVPAICDPKVATQCPSRELQSELGSALVELFVSLLKGTLHPRPRYRVSLSLMFIVFRSWASGLSRSIPQRALVGSPPRHSIRGVVGGHSR